MAITTLSSAQPVGNVPRQWENPTLGVAGGVMAIKALHDGYQKIPVDDKVKSGEIVFFFLNFCLGKQPLCVQGCKTQDILSCFMILWLVGSELGLGGVCGKDPKGN